MISSDPDARVSATTGRRGNQAAEIADVLRNDIIAGKLAHNAKLRQEQLAERFGVSRMPIREALRLLESEGLIVFEPNKSAKVAPFSIADLAEITEMRIAAETLALRTALPELSNAQIDRAAAVQLEMEQAPVSEFGALNAAFHMALYTACKRPRLLTHINVLGYAADCYLRMTIARLAYAQKSHREHCELLQCCRERNETAAIDCLTGHIGQAGEALATLLIRSRRSPGAL